jgi:hypothetical protein
MKMAKNEQKKDQQVAGLGQKVVEFSAKCCFEECKKRPERASFCSEHFTWFKEGLLTKEGKKPRDFDKKWISFLQRNKAA